MNPTLPTSYAIATWITGRSPRWLLYWAAKVGGRAQYYLSRERRESYLDNTKEFIKFNSQVRPWHAFENQALNVLELLKSVSHDEKERLRQLPLHGHEHIDRALAAGKGLILTTFHSGNWELSGLMLAARGYPITTVAGEQLRKGWSEPVKALKRRFGIRVVSPDASVRNLYRDLRANRIVVLHIDGDVFKGGFNVPFLGKTVAVPRGPAHLSRVLGAPVALAYCRRRNRHELHTYVEPPDDPPATASGEEPMTRSLVSRIEKCVLEEPGQWCIFRKL